MPAQVSVKTPPNATPLRVLVAGTENGGGSKRTPSPSPSVSRSKPTRRSPDKNHVDESSLDNADVGPFLLKLARDTTAYVDYSNKASDYAIGASESFERCSGLGLELAMSLDVLAAIYSSLGRFGESLPVLERSIELSILGNGSEHALAKFSGCILSGDTYSIMGQLDQSIKCCVSGLRTQIEALGDSDPRVAETCRYFAEAHVQVIQFDEAENLCKKTPEIHKEQSAPASIEEAADCRLMAIVHEAKGYHESALKHIVLASMSMIANGHENEVAATDVSIGSNYLSLCRFDETIFAYQKALTVFKSIEGEIHISLASFFICLADLYYMTVKLRESKSYSENALRIYAKPVSRTISEEIASGLTEVLAIDEALNDAEEALKLLEKAMKSLEHTPGNRSTTEAQMAVMFYMVGRCGEARSSFESAVAKLQANGESKSPFFGIVLNQMGLANVQLHRIEEAVELFEEARKILKQESGSCHLETLGVYSNLAAIYDTMGRVEDAIEILACILKMREEKLGTANPDVYDEKKSLAELLKEARRTGNSKGKSLQNLLDTNSYRTKESSKWGSTFHFRS